MRLLELCTVCQQGQHCAPRAYALLVSFQDMFAAAQRSLDAGGQMAMAGWRRGKAA